MRALVLAAGRGTRIRTRTRGRCKGMLSIHGKPLLEYGLDNAVACGVSGIVLVIGDHGEMIREHYGREYRGVPLQYARQDEPRGLVDAIEIGAPLLDGDDFMLFLSDELLVGADHPGMTKRFHERRLSVICGVMEGASPEAIRNNYDVIAGADRRIHRLVEKPMMPAGRLLGLGNCIFRSRVLRYLRQVPLDPQRGRKDLPDLIQCAIDAGEPVEYFRLCTGYANVNSPQDLESALRLAEAMRHDPIRDG